MNQFLPLLFIGLSGLCLLAALAAFWLSLRGLLGGEESALATDTEAGRHYAELLEEKEAVLRSIKDLSFEHEVGKLSDGDFERLNTQFRGRAKQIMKELERDLGPHRDQARALLEQARGAEGNAT